MVLKQIFMRASTTRASRTYFGSAWEFWKREIHQGLWDWAVDGPFCRDVICGQRLVPAHAVGSWRCIRCGAKSIIPTTDLATLRGQVVQYFEEEARQQPEFILS